MIACVLGVVNRVKEPHYTNLSKPNKVNAWILCNRINIYTADISYHSQSNQGLQTAVNNLLYSRIDNSKEIITTIGAISYMGIYYNNIIRFFFCKIILQIKLISDEPFHISHIANMQFSCLQRQEWRNNTSK